jgi:hypothetical protein
LKGGESICPAAKAKRAKALLKLRGKEVKSKSLTKADFRRGG